MKAYNKLQQGFTLIELMIVVAIIGVLAAIAIPAYQDYVTKSEASSALATLKALQTPAELLYQEHGTLAVSNALSTLGTSVNANPLGEISVVSGAISFKFTKSGALKEETMTLTRNTSDGWQCKLNGTKLNSLNLKACSTTP